MSARRASTASASAPRCCSTSPGSRSRSRRSAPRARRAQLLSWSRFCWRFRRSRGAGRGGVPPVEEALAFGYTPAELEYIEYARSRSAVGDPDQVREQLEAFSREYGTDEMLLVTITHDFSDRVRSYELVAEACGLAPASTERG